MRKLILSIIAITITSLAISQSVSPELVSSSGDNFSNTTYQLDWSVGECVTATHSSGSYAITQGFHQSSYVVTKIKDLGAEIEMSVFPNPTSDFITLKFDYLKVESMQYAITDLSGKVLASDKILSNLQVLNFTNYSPGTYFISVSENDQLIKSYKIIKN